MPRECNMAKCPRWVTQEHFQEFNIGLIPRKGLTSTCPGSVIWANVMAGSYRLMSRKSNMGKGPRSVAHVHAQGV